MTHANGKGFHASVAARIAPTGAAPASESATIGCGVRPENGIRHSRPSVPVKNAEAGPFALDAAPGRC